MPLMDMTKLFEQERGSCLFSNELVMWVDASPSIWRMSFCVYMGARVMLFDVSFTSAAI